MSNEGERLEDLQRSKRGAGAHRARYNSSLMDANQTNSGDNRLCAI